MANIGPNHKYNTFFSSVPKSPNHMGLNCVKKSDHDLVMLGPI
jgi:hypothetical protein